VKEIYISVHQIYGKYYTKITLFSTKANFAIELKSTTEFTKTVSVISLKSQI